MKKLLLIIIIIIFNLITTIKSQTLVKTNKVWSVVECLNFGACKTYFNRFEGDTIIGDNQYKKLYATYDSSLGNWYYIGAMREDSTNRVYYISGNTTNENLYYDFRLNQSDTFNFHVFNNTYQMIVNSIDTVTLINGEKRKRINFNNFEEWIDGVGSLLGLTKVGIYFYIFDYYPELNCFIENDSLIYHNSHYPLCYYTTEGITELNNTNISIFPNPTKDNLTIKTNANQKQKLEILNLIGQTVYTIYIDKHTTINTSAFANSVYLLKISSDKGTMLTKFIKQ